MRASTKSFQPIDPDRQYRIHELTKMEAIGRPAGCSVWRWCTRGVKAGDHRVMLTATRVGGKRLVRGSDLLAFLEGCNAASPPTTCIISPAEQRRRVKAAETTLTKMGI